ncbi:MAG: hypothetical protein DHS20C18_00870 [Saprospiraceae bacterium]|nr:MAG: hypothetical protein DHS20C18_00870 [Saprospiraceae bacterium]
MSAYGFGIAQNKTSNGWIYETLKEGHGSQLNSDQAALTHNRLVDENGRELVSTYAIGVPDYQIVSELSQPFQNAFSVMREDGRYKFKIPIEDFKAAAKSGSKLKLPGEYLTWELELVKILPPLPDIARVVKEAYQNGGIDGAFQEFQSHSNSRGSEVYMGEWEVNEVGYFFMSKQKPELAIEAFEYNTRQNPRSANAHDSLAEAYLKTNQKEKAVQHYRQSYKLNPQNDNARKMLKELAKN